MNEGKGIMKNAGQPIAIAFAIIAISLAAAMSASAQGGGTYSGTALNDLAYSVTIGPSTDAQYVPASGSVPAYAALYTADASTSGDSPAVFIEGALGTLSSFSGSYTLLSNGQGPGPGNVQPYWTIWVSPLSNPVGDYWNDYAIYTLGGSPLTGSSTIHAYDPNGNAFGTWGETLSALDATSGDESDGLLGNMTVDWVGLEIGNGGSGAASANIESITVVPEPSTLALVGLGVFGALMLRRRRA
jgi:hypothetical protein